MKLCHLSRRRLLQGAGTAALAATTATPFRILRAQDSVAILGILPLTGPYAADELTWFALEVVE